MEQFLMTYSQTIEVAVVAPSRVSQEDPVGRPRTR